MDSCIEFWSAKGLYTANHNLSAKKKKNSHVQNEVQTQTVSDKSLDAEDLFHTAGCLMFNNTFERIWDRDIFDSFLSDQIRQKSG